jgi:hypothetical protein
LNSNNQLELSAGTLRQRRNLLVTAIILIMAHHADIKIGKGLQLQGISFEIGNPDQLHKLLYVGLLYFAWRFYQYFSSDQANSFIKTQYRELRDRMLDRAVLKEIFRANPEIKSLTGEYKYKRLQRDERYYYKVRLEGGQLKSGGNLKITEARIPKVRVEFRRSVAFLLFIARGKILTDFYLPFLLAAYAAYLYFV